MKYCAILRSRDVRGHAGRSRAARSRASRAGEGKTAGVYKPKLFNAHEYATVRRLAEIIIPADEVSGSAVEAGAPEFIDLICANNLKMGDANDGRDRMAGQTNGTEIGEELRRLSTGAANGNARPHRLSQESDSGNGSREWNSSAGFAA